ncbi:glutamate-1-semialdehyde 2,1-aminomutase [Anaerococcus sp. AGMB00486]|uniref:Glutamate-1-semialdehyde 2,1-aminomutase n=2 Tax=Anaerococcus TaxID=165779 RepID=A0ABX2NCT0_9FIRM|nr:MULTISPECIES: glutamate-1-semialdehyde 2,1-aminomutase [Anaerococcus]MSS78613.1 glutamate-1-semialdehyde-2,1-aminomutase [Anaerococcus porci]NVF12481.1 glutamate-1-semialdehyde 2,1-aminomutase [Anaerococcus faecalis]
MTLFDKAKKYIPGGVNSPVRAFAAVGGHPIFAKYGKGHNIVDENNDAYIDFISSWGPMILGHGKDELIEKAKGYLEEGLTFGLPTKVEVEIAEFLSKAFDTDMVRMVNSGTEATMSAIRLARGFTNKSKIIKFEGCYHGHSDGLLVKSGSGSLTFNVPTSAGVPENVIKDTLICKYNDIESVKKTIKENKDDVAAIILEPIAGNMGVVPIDIDFVKALRKISDENGIILIFDEVITAFRLKFGSISTELGVKPDMFCFGKIVGGGMPVGGFAGRREIMEKLSPMGPVYQAGTLSGSPFIMKMGLDVLRILKENPDIYQRLEKYAQMLEEGFNDNLKATGVKACVTRYKSMMSLFFGDFDEIRSFDDVSKADLDNYSKYFNFMKNSKILMPPSQFEAIFMSDALDESVINYTIEENKKALEYIKEN